MEIKRVSGVTEAVLSRQLKQLEGDGLISRQVFGSRPPLKTEYALTAFGRSFLPALQMLTDWGNQVINERGRFLPEPPG
ncbi:winged helix-turn-helix transcriptional regulator [Eikenella halliae]|uniref:winged helix-turn-helix transcriptional regulator n=1 Tax=Eikenella halliae TaxID=1795832 RepID=UPI00370DB5AD